METKEKMIRGIKAQKPTINNLFTCFSFLVVGVTGIVRFIVPYQRLIVRLHCLFGFVFVVITLLHLKRNWKGVATKGTRKELGLSLIITLGLLLGVAFNIQPFRSIESLGQQLQFTHNNGNSQLINVSSTGTGRELVFHNKAGSHYAHKENVFGPFGYIVTPQIAFWVEDLEGNFIETLYVTKKEATGSYLGVPERKESLPYWSHKQKTASPDKSMLSSLDSVTSATPVHHFHLVTRADHELQDYFVLAEVNKGFDYNDYYRKDLQPGEPGYNTGYSGQPAIVYAARIDHHDGHNVYPLQPIGHSSPTGEDGTLYNDLSQLDTALDIMETIILEIKE